MYDKVAMLLPFPRNEPQPTQYLTRGKQQTDLATGEAVIYGEYKGLKVNVHPGKIVIIGSLARVIYPNNIYPLDIYTTKEAVNALSDGLHLDISGATVTALEYGTQYVMRRPVAEYLKLLGEMPKMNRLATAPTSLYYRGMGKRPGKEFVFYDKQADALAKNMQIPGGLDGCNLLKFEMRLKGHLTRQLKTTNIQAATLWDRDFYRLLLRKYQNSYFSINTNRKKRNDMGTIKTVSDAFNVFVARLMEHSNQEEISSFLDDLRAANVFEDRKYYTRLKSKIQSLNDWKNTTSDDEQIKELDDAIRNIGNYV